MNVGLFKLVVVVTLAAILCKMETVFGIRFSIDREECISHNVESEGAIVHFSFVVIKSEKGWYYAPKGVDLVVKEPTGLQIQDFRDKMNGKSEFVVRHKGVHRFCFTNRSPYHETLDFDVHETHFSYYDQHAEDEHFKPLLEQISKLQEALHNIQFEQHFIEADSERQATVNIQMSWRAIHKAIYESAAVIGASILQVYLLKRLFARKVWVLRV